MGRRLRIVSLILLGTLLGSEALSVPKHKGDHQDALSKGNGSEEDLQTWHGLDYEYSAFDHSEWERNRGEGQKKVNGSRNGTTGLSGYEQFYLDEGWSDEDEDYSWFDSNSEEDYSYMDDIIIAGSGKPKSSTTRKPMIVEQEKNKTGVEGQEDDDRVITIGAKKATPVVVSSSPAPNNGDKKNEEVNPADYWAETEGDSDDGEGGQVVILGDLPTDNDIDKDKYLDPERYKDTIAHHAIEDLLMREWTVTYPGTNLPCIMLRGSIKLVVPLNPSWYNHDFVEIAVPYDALASGTCNSLKNDYQEIILTWSVTRGEDKTAFRNQVVLGFATNWTSEFTDLNIPEDKYALVAVTAAYYKGELGLNQEDKGIISYSANDLAEFMTPLNQSMSCYQNKQILLGSMQLTMSGIQLEAFRLNRETLTVGEFSRSVLCSMDEIIVFDAVMTFIIWFWIGALLVVLAIFIVLLALGYRRRQGQEEGFGYKILTA